MLGYLLQIDALDGTPLRFASHDEPELCHIKGAKWLPAMGRLPRLRYDFFGGEFASQITRPSADFELSLEAVPDYAKRGFADARARLYRGTIGQTNFKLLFAGKVLAEPKVASGRLALEVSPDDAWLDTPLLDPYAGTDGIEGPEELTGNAKPLVLGRARFVPGVQIDAVDEVYQVSAYGEIEAVQAVYDRGQRLTATSDHANLAALLAATLEGGEYATCLASGLVRLGSPPDGLLTFDIDGDADTAWVRKPGAMIGRIAEIAGGAVNQANLDALDTARPYNLAALIAGQTTARQVIQSICDSVGAVAGIGWTGGLFVQPLGIGVPSKRFAGGGGEVARTDAPVADVRVEPVASPFWRLATEAEPTWVVHDRSDIATGYVLRGEYSADRVYRLDDLVFASDGRTFAYINATAGSGNAPPSQPSTSNSYWEEVGSATAGATAAQVSDIAQALSDASNAQATADGKIQSFFASTAPTAEGVGDLWFDTDDGNKPYRWSGSAWVAVQDGGIGDALTAAAGAQSTADGKVTTFVGESTPTPEGVGDLWYRASTGYLQRWSGSAWVDVSNIGATAAQISDIADALSDAANAQATADGKIVTFYQTTMPSGSLGDLWFDTDDGNKQYRHNGTTFIAVQDAAIGQALTDAAGAQATADGKVTTFVSESSPTADATGDLWFKTSTGELRRWSGSAWGDPLVDLTAATQITFSDPAPFEIQANSSGVTTTDLSLLTRSIKVYKGGTQQTSGVTIGTTTASPSAAISIDTATVSSGVVTVKLDQADASGSVSVPVIFGGKTYPRTIVVTRNQAAPVSGGGGGGGVPPFIDSEWTNIASTSFIQVTDLDAQIESDASGHLNFTVSASYYGGTAQIKAQYSTNGSSWTDVTSGSATGTASVDTPGEEEPGFVSLNITQTGLTAETSYYVRLVAARTSGSTTLSWSGPSFTVQHP